MLCLRQYLEGKIIVEHGGERLVITIMDHDPKHDTVRLGFDAPKSFVIDRAKIFHAKQEQKRNEGQ